MKNFILVFFVSLIWFNISTAEEKEIIFSNEEEVVNSYQAQAISYGLVDKITDTLKTYIQESHVPLHLLSEPLEIPYVRILLV